jgi:hypothetical protein
MAAAQAAAIPGLLGRRSMPSATRLAAGTAITWRNAAV